MAEENVATVADTASTTPAAAEPVVTATETNDEPWDFSNVDDTPEAASESTPEVAKETPADPAAEAEKAPEAAEKTAEDEVLEDVFGEPQETKELTEAELEALPASELIERQKNRYAKEWAERNAKKADVLKKFQHDTPIAEVVQSLEEISKERFAELSQHAAHSLVDANPEATFKRAYAVKMLAKDPNWDPASPIPTLDELISGNAQPAARPQATPAEISALTADLDKALEWDWRDEKLDENFLDAREQALAKTLRAVEAVSKAAIAEKEEANRQLADKAKELEGLKAGKQETDNTALQAKLHETTATYRSSVSEKLLPYIEKHTGLAPSKEDTPEVAAFKASRMELFTGTAYEKANGIDSAFETFAYTQSSVKNQIEEVATRIVDAQLRESHALLNGNAEDAAKFHAAAEEERIPMMNLMAKASMEFTKLRITPDMNLIGKLSSKLAEPIKEASERVEVVSNGAGHGASPRQTRDYESAEDVWGSMVDEAVQEDALRANA